MLLVLWQSKPFPLILLPIKVRLVRAYYHVVSEHIPGFQAQCRHAHMLVGMLYALMHAHIENAHKHSSALCVV